MPGDWPPMDDAALLRRRDQITSNEFIDVGRVWYHSPFNWVVIKFVTDALTPEGDCETHLNTIRAQVRVWPFSAYWDELFLYCGRYDEDQIAKFLDE